MRGRIGRGGWGGGGGGGLERWGERGSGEGVEREGHIQSNVYYVKLTHKIRLALASQFLIVLLCSEWTFSLVNVLMFAFGS